MSGNEYLNSFGFNGITASTSPISLGAVDAGDDSHTSIMTASDISSENYAFLLSELKEDEIELIKKELEREIQEQKNTIKNKKETEGWLTSTINGVAGFFGAGDKKAENNILEYEKLLSGLDFDVSNIDEVYKTITGADLDLNALQSLQNSKNIANQIDSETKSAIVAELENQIAQLEDNFEAAQNLNGWMSGTWNKFKNWTGIGASSNKTSAEISDLKEQIEKLKNSEADLAEAFKNITGEDLNYDNLNALLSGEKDTGLDSISKAGQSVNKYLEGQKMCTDVAGDIVSGIAAVGALAAAPLTGGTSILLAAGVGAATKVAIKASDCIGNEKTYDLKDLGYDLTTGSINGAIAPISNGLGGAAGTGVAKVFGLETLEQTAKKGLQQAIKQTGKEVFEESAEQAGKGILTKILAKGGSEYVLKEGAKATAKTTIGKIFAYGTDMAVDGALSGAVDGFARAAAEGRWDDIPQEVLTGGLGGLIASPVIGGGFRLAGKTGSTVINKINNKITIANLLPDGTTTKFSQGDIGDCALLSVLDGFLGNPKTAKQIQNAITTSSDGGYNVKIGSKTIKIAREELTDEMLSDTTGIRVFELAYQKAGGSLDGEFAENVAKTFGLNPVHISSDGITDEVLETISKDSDNLILSLGARIDADGTITPDGEFQHYFSIKNIDTNSKTLTLVDTYDTSKTFEMSFDDIKTQGISIDGGSIKKTNLPNVERSIDETEFYGLIRKIKNKLLKSDEIISIETGEQTKETSKKGILSKIKSGWEFAKKAYDNDNFVGVEDLSDKFKPDSSKLQTFLLFNNDAQEYCVRRGTTDLMKQLDVLHQNGAPDEEIIECYKRIIESLGTGPTKYAQNISGDEAKLSNFLSYLDGKMDEHEISLIREAIKQTKSNCSFTRTETEALYEVQTMFNDMGIVKLDKLSAASIGETYRATLSDGSVKVIKMIKKGVTDESLNEEMLFVQKLLPAIAADGTEDSAEESIKMLDNIYDSFHEELDFTAEATANRRLRESLERSQVAQVRTVSDDCRALVMDMAEGVQANKLFPILQQYSSEPTFKQAIDDMIAVYKVNPDNFDVSQYTEGVQKYAKMLKDHPALAKPLDIMLSLPKSLTESFSEQMMFLKNIDGNVGAIMHGDPHTGNFFINFKDNGVPIIQYIDTGNTVTSDAIQVVKNLKFFTSYFTGNTDEMASYLVESCKTLTNNKNLSRDELIEYISKEIKEQIFKFDSGETVSSGQRITNFGDVYTSMQTILKNLDLSMSPDIANYQKAQGMFLDAITTTNKFTGQSFDMGLLIKDIMPAIKAMKKNGANPKELIKTIFKHIITKPEQAVGTIGQFRLNSKDKKAALEAILKELENN